MRRNLESEVDEYLKKHSKYQRREKIAWSEGGVLFKVAIGDDERTLFATSLEENQTQLVDCYREIFEFSKEQSSLVDCEEMHIKEDKENGVCYVFIIMEKITPMTTMVFAGDYIEKHTNNNVKKINLLSNIIQVVENIKLVEKALSYIKINIKNQEICVTQNKKAKLQLFDMIKNKTQPNHYYFQLKYIMNNTAKVLGIELCPCSDDGNIDNLLRNCIEEKQLCENLEKENKKVFDKNIQLADTKNSIVYTNLGYIYENGIGTNIDYQEAIKWYEKAIRQKYAPAYNNMAHMYQKGFGVEKNYEKALWYLKKAAKLEDDVAQLNLAAVYQKGQGVKADMKKALYWYKKAAKNGNEIALKMYERMK